MRDQDDVSQCRVRPGARAGQQAAVLRAGSPHQPVSPQYAFQEEQEKPLPVHSSQCCKCCPVPAAQQDPPTAPSPPAPHIGDAQEWGPCLPWGAGPQPKWGSTSPHTLSPSLFPSSLPCLPVFLCCLPAPQCGSPPVGLSRSGQGCGGTWQWGGVRTVSRGAWARGSKAGERLAQWGQWQRYLGDLRWQLGLSQPVPQFPLL